MNKVYNIKEIKAMLPQRAPMLLLDRAQQIDETHFVGLKCVTNNEAFFLGHFPNHPIMPGVLQLEAMKQLAELAITDKIEHAGKQIYIKRVEKVKFRKPVNPGDRIKLEAEILSCDSEVAVLKVNASTKYGPTCEAVLTLSARTLEYPKEMPEFNSDCDRSDTIAMDYSKVMNTLPHRFPFLLIDQIIETDGVKIKAVKNISINEPIFADGTLETMPESLLCEICAQAGCVTVLSRPENAGKIGYFMSIDFADALAPIYPGDQLDINIEIPPSKGKFGKGFGYIAVNGKKVFESALMFAVVDA
jgi:3-hydroxymyristoyl/3-hydroxydecanoyl-(acyl carrier protein) dehydratase